MYNQMRYPKTYDSNRLFNIRFAEWIHTRFFKKPGKVLDIGSGRGWLLEGFSKLNYETYGTDKDSDGTDLDKDKLKFQPSKFDYIISKDTIEHLNNPCNLLKESYRLLKSKGKIIIITPGAETMTFGEFYSEYTHKTPFTKKALRQALQLHGFKNIKIHYIRNLPYIWRWTLKAFDSQINLLSMIEHIKKLKLPKLQYSMTLLAEAQK